jgi:hypothetical protein
MNLAMRFLTAGKSSERQTPPDTRASCEHSLENVAFVLEIVMQQRG